MKTKPISFNNLVYMSLPLFKVAPNGSNTPVLSSLSFAIDFIIAGLNC